MKSWTSAVGFEKTPRSEVDWRVGQLVRQGWQLQVVYVRKDFPDGTTKEAAEVELEQIMGSYWVTPDELKEALWL